MVDHRTAVGIQGPRPQDDGVVWSRGAEGVHGIVGAVGRRPFRPGYGGREGGPLPVVGEFAALEVQVAASGGKLVEALYGIGQVGRKFRSQAESPRVGSQGLQARCDGVRQLTPR